MINCSKEEIEHMIEVIQNSEDFKKLKDKTQNFPDPKHPEVYTRQDHTLDVVSNALEIAKAISDEEKIKKVIEKKGRDLNEQESVLLRKLRNINLDRTHLIALCHDIGHTPFGHHGEHFFDRLLKTYGSDFTHYQHSTRVVKNIFERNGIDMPEGLGAAIEAHSSTSQSDEIKRTIYIEPHIVRRSDKITYMIQDLDDMCRLGLFTDKDKEALRNLYIDRSREWIEEFGLDGESMLKVQEDWARQFDEFFSLDLQGQKQLVIDDIGTTTISNYINGKEKIESSIKIKTLLEEMNAATFRVISRDETKKEDKTNVILMRLWWEIYNNQEEYKEKTERWKDYTWEERCVYYLCEHGVQEIEKMYESLGKEKALKDEEFKNFVKNKLTEKKDRLTRRYIKHERVIGTEGYTIEVIQKDAAQLKAKGVRSLNSKKDSSLEK